jgi:hypothetical protein
MNIGISSSPDAEVDKADADDVIDASKVRATPIDYLLTVAPRTRRCRCTRCRDVA